jgi:hypothetical protein
MYDPADPFPGGFAAAVADRELLADYSKSAATDGS